MAFSFCQRRDPLVSVPCSLSPSPSEAVHETLLSNPFWPKCPPLSLSCLIMHKAPTGELRPPTTGGQSALPGASPGSASALSDAISKSDRHSRCKSFSGPLPSARCWTTSPGQGLGRIQHSSAAHDPSCGQGRGTSLVCTSLTNGDAFLLRYSRRVFGVFGASIHGRVSHVVHLFQGPKSRPRPRPR